MSATPSPLAEIYDLAIIGGGINGSGIAADAAGRGLRVFLCEKDDLAAHTSSTSSKLIHGGLRYLEQYQFRLVREALAEREVLLKKAPHIIAPLRFILPHRPHLRPAWVIRLGLFLYDHLDRQRRLPGSRGVRFSASSPLKADITRGFEYSDCWVDDARLVVLNALAARENGAHIHTRTRCISGHRNKGLWHLHLERRDGSCFSIRSRALVNAGGPWVEQCLTQALKQPSDLHMRLVQGSHLIVPRLFDGEQAYILQNSDRRIVFALPYLQRFTLIGTTDRDFQGDPQQVAISAEESDYLLAVVNAHFRKQLSTTDILHSFSGVRPLYDDAAGNPAVVTRDYRLAVNGTADSGLLLSVFGGKLTTYRCLAEAALQLLQPAFPAMDAAWTAEAPLPGGEHMQNPQQLADELLLRHDWLPPALALRWAGSYGSRLWPLLGKARSLAELGEHFGAQLYAREVDYLCQEEWALEAEDILWRRTKMGLFLTPAQQQRLQQYLQQRADLGALVEVSPAQPVTR